MATPVSFAVTAAMLFLAAAPALAGGGRQSQPSSSYSPSGAPMRHMEFAAQQPRHGSAVTVPRPAAPASAPTAPASPYQPSYSIDRKDWWQPHPYFQSNGQGFGYPTHGGSHSNHGGSRPYSDHGVRGR